jgi:hypothetical protein
MELVQDAFFVPGCCHFCDTSKSPFVDTIHYNSVGQRIYICVPCAETIGATAGLPTVQSVAALEEQLEGAEAELTHLRERLDELAAVVDEAEALRLAFAYTMEKGWVIDPKKMTLRPRVLPGMEKIDVTKPLVPDPEPAPAVAVG